MGSTLSQHHSALSLFAEAIVQAPIPVDPIESGSWPEHPSDPASGRVGAPPELDDEGEAARLRYRSIIMHQLVALEERRGLAFDTASMTRDHPLLPTVFAMLEDLRVDAITRQRYPGAESGLDLVLRSARADLRDDGLGPVLDALHRRSLGTPMSAIRREVEGCDQATMELVEQASTRVDRTSATIFDVLREARRLCSKLSAAGIAIEDIAEIEAGVDPSESPAEAPRGVSLDCDGTVGEVESAHGLSGAEATEDPMPHGSNDAERADQGEDVEPHRGPELAFTTQRSAPDRSKRTFVYDEWDHRHRRHLPAWCRLLEERLEGDDVGFELGVRTRHAELRSQIRRRFSRLRADELIRVHRSDDGDEIDIDAVIEAIGDRRSGAPAGERPYIRRDRAARDVATVLLVDLSASTGSPVDAESPAPATEVDPTEEPLSYAPIWRPPDADPVAPRRVIDVAKDAVALMADALGELGDRYAIYGFSGTGRHHVEFKIVKDFHDRVSAQTWGAVAAMRPLRYTRMGTAIRHATTRLAAESARTRLLIVISDGYPQDVDYGENPRDRSYGIYDTARAIADAGSAGIDTFCITIDPAGHDYLREMYPDRRYLVIDDVESLPAELAKVYLGMRTG